MNPAKYHRMQMPMPARPAWTIASAAAIGLSLGLAACRSLPASKPQAQWSPEEARGAVVFHNNCARCHYPDNRQNLHGPGLQALTKLKSMPSGAPPSDERITAVIRYGRNMMPGSQLDDQQLHDLLAYLHSL